MTLLSLKRAILMGTTILALLGPSFAQDDWQFASSAVGEPKYTQGFTHFDYVNPDAPKGGTVRMGATGSFDTFNPILPKGEAANGIGLVYESLMTPAMDQVLTSYGLIAEAFKYPADYSSVTFRLNPAARWHDGTPITPEDVVWSFEKLKELNPSKANYYANVTKAEISGDREVTFSFDQINNRELPKIVGEFQILPKHWWEGTDARGNKRNIGASTLEPPLGSGPYELASFDAGRSIVYKRVQDYWGAKHPTQVGQNNFDEIRYEYFLDLTVQFEAFKGDQLDWWNENAAARWQQAYNFPAVNDGRVVKELFPQDYNGSGIMMGFVPNLRNPKFQDERVRRAINLAFDFEELNRTLFFGQYERLDSYFYGIPLRWEGLPQGEELDILNSVRHQVPASVFDTQYTNPIGGDPTKLRANLRKALALFSEAGYNLQGNQLVDASGQQLSFEILLNGPTIEPIAGSLVSNLAQIGVNATIRTVDSPQYINRTRNREFDIIYHGWAQSFSPGNEQRDFWGSSSADKENSENHLGIKDPGIDALIEKVIYADDRETLEASTRALDRVLLAHNFMVPSYTLRNSRVARWDRFGHPETLPEFSSGFPTIWWYDEAKAAKTGR